jgi:hypothetical protein
MKQAISGAMANRKRTMKMGVKNQPKNDGTIVAAINHKTTVRLTSRVQYQSSPVPVESSTNPDQLAVHEHQPDGLLGEQKIEELIHWIS